MIKSLTVSIESVEKGEHISITGTQKPDEFVKEVVLTVGTYKVALNSQDLAEALKVLVDFQTPPRGTYIIPTGNDIQNVEPTPIGMANMGWTK